MAKSIVNSDGRTTIPVQVRAALKLKAGTRLHWHVTPSGDVFVRAKTSSILDLAGSLSTNEQIDVEDMNP